MDYGLRAALKRLDQFAAEAKLLSSPDFRTRLNRVLGETAQSELDTGFTEQRDPYGKAWLRSGAADRRSGQTLSATARLRRSFSSPSALKPHQRGFTLGTTIPYAAVHQTGGVVKISKHGKRSKKGTLYRRVRIGEKILTITRDIEIPQRMIVPEGDLGPIWGPALEEAAAEFTMGQFDD